MSNPERLDPQDHSFSIQTLTHHVNRYEFACQFASGNILDLCCGFGYGTAILQNRYPNSYVIGIDVDRQTIKTAQHRYPHCKYLNCNVKHYKPTSIFDTVVMFEAIEHLSLQDGRNILETIYNNILSSDGCLIISTPRDTKQNINHFHKSTWSLSLLQNTLERLYSFVDVYGQDWETGIVSKEDIINNDFYICICRK